MSHEALAKLVRTFMAHVKSNGFTREDLEKRWAQAGRSYRSRVFLDLYWPIHDAWQARLRADDSIDFEDMLMEAAKHVEAGTDMGYDDGPGRRVPGRQPRACPAGASAGGQAAPATS